MKRWKVLLGLICMFFITIAMPAYGKDDAPRISTKQLNNILDSPDLVILDVRTEKDWKKSDRKITGAVRVDPFDVSSWAKEYAMDNKIVLYCA
jgi:rhodanese-related sulfurtransferase